MVELSEPSPTHAELEIGKAARLARLRVERHQRYVHYLQLARRIRLDNTYSEGQLADVLRQAHDELDDLTHQAGGRILPRRRPIAKVSPDACTVYIDECGSHALTSKDAFGSFSLAAIIVRDSDFGRVDQQWKRWKRYYLGSAFKKVHEPDTRRLRGSFWCDGNRTKQQRALVALETILQRLEFRLVACVIDRHSYASEVAQGDRDETLPRHPYVMALHLLAERLAITLHQEFEGARGHIVVEARGPLEDAIIQYEFARLFLDGTSFVSATWFRQQFYPGLEFRDKSRNSTGLQIADLLARACGEKILDPTSVPKRWRAAQAKFCKTLGLDGLPVGLGPIRFR